MMKSEKGDERKAMTDPLMADNPFVDVAAYLFLEDIADKQGAAGMNTYLMSLASSLAKSMPMEEYRTWDDFLDALRNNESIITSFENVVSLTDNCIVTTVCPYSSGWEEYTKRIGKFSHIHTEVAEYYNSTVKPGAVDTGCVIHQTFRTAAAERIKVAGRPVRYAQIAAILSDGRKKMAPDEWIPILLEKAGITQTELNMIIRNNACVFILYQE
jgi:hypothetical protein